MSPALESEELGASKRGSRCGAWGGGQEGARVVFLTEPLRSRMLGDRRGENSREGISGSDFRTWRISGARQKRDPTAFDEISKSVMTISTFVDAESTTKMLEAFRSLWMTPCACKHRIPRAICAIRDKLVMAENGFVFRSIRERRSHS